jgi:hypothetical protein
MKRIGAGGWNKIGLVPLTRYQITKRFNERHPERRKATKRAYTLSTYGLTQERYAALLESQNHACAICHATDPQHWSGQFHIDHDHVTGAVRGLLCTLCNGGLGLFKDDPATLQRALDYFTAPSAAVGYVRIG